MVSVPVLHGRLVAEEYEPVLMEKLGRRGILGLKLPSVVNFAGRLSLIMSFPVSFRNQIKIGKVNEFVSRIEWHPNLKFVILSLLVLVMDVSWHFGLNV